MAAADGGLPLLLKALRFAAHKHRDQRRKDERASPYINHPIQVAETLCTVGGVHDAVALAAAILHDTIEDTETTGAELEAEFGREIRAVVEEVTDDQTLPREERKRRQIERAAGASLRARQVKLADKICNIQDIIEAPPAGWSVARRQEYVAWAQAVVDRIRGTNAALERRFDALCRQAARHLPGEPR